MTLALRDGLRGLMRTFSTVIATLPLVLANAQYLSGAMEYAVAKEYTIGGITVSGCVTRDTKAVELFSGLQVGDKITVPGERIGRAIQAIWDQHLFTDVRIEATRVQGTTIFLNIAVQENPQLAGYGFGGTVSRNEGDKLREELRLEGGMQVNDALIAHIRSTIRRYFTDKGHLKADAQVKQVADTADQNKVSLTVLVDPGPRVRIKDIFFHGNAHVKSARLRRALKNTKRKRWYNVFGSSKFKSSDFRDDQQGIVALYNEKGFRNATVVKDTMGFVSKKKIQLDIWVDEGNQFYFRDIDFVGNTKYSSDTLQTVLRIKKGDIYNKRLLETRLYQNPSGADISSLYMDRGYLSFYPDPVERVEGDSIDLEIRIREGRQYRVRNVTISGNTKTFDHVIRREIRTLPGDLFDRSEVIRSQQQLIGLGFFDPEKVGVNPTPDPRTGLVDLNYTVEEKPSDRLELSGGYGAGRLLLSLGLSFTNFSLRKIFDGKAWSPLPAGDGQTLNLRAQTNGKYYQSYSLSFVEPWLGGRKPTSLSVSGYYTRQTNGASRGDLRSDGSSAFAELGILGTSIGLGKRLKWPDDYFFVNLTASYQQYRLNNWATSSGSSALFSFSDGTSNVYALQARFARRSIQEPFWITQGSEMSLSVKATPPFSVFRPEVIYTDLTPAEQYKLAEFHKWKFTTQWFTKLTRSKTKHDFVFMARAGFGFLGRYTARKGDSPFERFYLGGSGLTGFQLDGREIIALRGYDDLSLTPSTGSFYVNKFTAEIRFPVSLNPSATIFATTFVEGANAWNDIRRYDPFRLYRSAGIGLRLFLPMFGPMGLDYAWRFDDVPNAPSMAKSQFHFTIGIDLGEL
ncbi:MAG: outer membrane protein assembly factor BamA [Flavobacteriales bacterium]|nr:outer membrane protein assembly factor BamA [Flavobacteriales bacterium]